MCFGCGQHILNLNKEPRTLGEPNGWSAFSVNRLQRISTVMRVHQTQVNQNAQLDAMYAAQKAEVKRAAERTRKKLFESASKLAGEADAEACVVKLGAHEESQQEESHQDATRQRANKPRTSKQQSPEVDSESADSSISDWA